MNSIERLRGRSNGWTVTVLAGLLCISSGALQAQSQAPEGNIEITVGTSPGGTPDIIMRQLAQTWNSTGIVSNPIQVVNRTGGSWTVSNNYVTSEAGNDQLLYGIAQPVFTTPIVQGTQNAWDQLTPISMIVSGDLIVFTQPDSDETTLKELMDRARQEDLSVSFAGAQAGSTDSIVVAKIEEAAGVDLNYVPYDGGGAALAAFLGGNVDAIILPPSEAVDLLEAGRLQPLAILNDSRRSEPRLKDIPTAREQGIDVIWHQSWGIAGPPRMSPDIAEWWSGKVAEVIESDAWKKLVADNYWSTDYVPRSEAGAAFQDIYDTHLIALRNLGLAKQ